MKVSMFGSSMAMSANKGLAAAEYPLLCVPGRQDWFYIWEKARSRENPIEVQEAPNLCAKCTLPLLTHGFEITIAKVQSVRCK